MARRRETLNDDMTDHDRESHQEFDSQDFEFCNWNIAVVSNAEYSMLERVAKTSAFWRAIRRSPENPLFSGLRSGEIKASGI